MTCNTVIQHSSAMVANRNIRKTPKQTETRDAIAMQKYTATGHDVRTMHGRGYVLFSVGDTWCDEEVCTIVICSILCIMAIENVCTASSGQIVIGTRFLLADRVRQYLPFSHPAGLGVLSESPNMSHHAASE